VQVEVPLAFTLTVEHPVIVAPFAVKATLPEGATGESEAAESCAVKVTDVLTLVGLAGEAVRPRVAESAETTWVALVVVATV
jgi:hypothetical protein